MKRFRKSISIFIIALTLIFFGYLRDFLFKKINALLQAWDHDMDYEMPVFLKFLTTFEYDTIINFKWLLTFIFWGIYLLITMITVKLFFNNKLFLKIALAVYVGILLISSLFIGVGFLVPSSTEKMYEFARYLMGMAQSPLVLMILIPVLKLYERGNKQFNNQQ